MGNNNIETTISNGKINSIVAVLKKHKIFFIATLIANAIIIKIGLGVDRLLNFNLLLIGAVLGILIIIMKIFYNHKISFFESISLCLYYVNVLLFLLLYLLCDIFTNANEDFLYFEVGQVLFIGIIIYLPVLLNKIHTKYIRINSLSIPICFLLILLTTMQFFSFRFTESNELVVNNNSIVSNVRLCYVPFLMNTSSLYTIVPKIPTKDVEVKVVYKEGKDSKWKGEMSFDGYVLVDITPRNYSAYQKIQELHLKPIIIETKSRDGITFLVEEEILKQTNFKKGDINIDISGIG